MKISTLVLSPLSTNCYLVKTGDNSGVVIDPADKASAIIKEADKLGIRIEKILLTHGHFDHFSAAGKLRDEIKKAEKKAAKEIGEVYAEREIPVYIHKDDSCMLEDSNKSLAYFCPSIPFTPLTADVLLSDGTEIRQDGIVFSVMHTPGHSAGSVCYIVKDEKKNIMFSGDTIFRDSIGRSDGYSGDYIVQKDTLRKLTELTEDYIILPGHGEPTTLSEEKIYNPFINGQYQL